MEKFQVKSIVENLQQGKGNGKFEKLTPKALPNKTAKRLARKKLYKQLNYIPGTLGSSNVANKLTRQERRSTEDFTPQYNGQRFKKVTELVVDEKKPYKQVLKSTYEKIS